MPPILQLFDLSRFLPPPEPLMVSLWATDIYLPEPPIPTAHRDIPRFVVSAPAVKVASPPKALKIDIPPPVLSAVLSVAAATVEPAASVDDSPPKSPLTDLDQLDVPTPTLTTSDPTKIARPIGAARIALPLLFADWNTNRLDEVQTTIRTLAKSHLDRTNFQGQSREKLTEFYRLMAIKFPFLLKYDRHWATVRLLQAYLKSKSSSAKNAATKKVVIAATALGGAPLCRTRSQTRRNFVSAPAIINHLCPHFTILIHAGAASSLYEICKGPCILSWNKTNKDCLKCQQGYRKHTLISPNYLPIASFLDDPMPNNRLSVISPPNHQSSFFLHGRLYPAIGRRCNVSIHVVAGTNGDRYPCVESIMGGDRTQPYVHDVRVQVVLNRPNGLVVSQFRCFFKRHQLLPHSSALNVRGDVVVMSVDKQYPDCVINMAPSDCAVADFVAQEFAAHLRRFQTTRRTLAANLITLAMP
ncbi:hypothetical protein B0H13DRAFT_2375721 [Mycena leptocephala]|nr:hypothetical protein B0H13DRAFT_2375721 [Mycena leptocephala]